MAPKGKNKRAVRQLSESIMSTINGTKNALSEMKFDSEAAELMKDVSLPKSAQQQAQLYRDMIQTTGTNMEQNDADPLGDGDQTPMRIESKCQVFRTIWNNGGDISMLLQTQSFSSLAMDCITGKKQQVQARLHQAATTPASLLTALLERRESCFRIPPILLVIGLAKHKPFVQSVTGIHPNHMDHEGVAKVLLQYGARPDAKDVAGKTAVHWGAGGAANDVTRNIADYCISAARTCHAYGKEVTLHGLTKEKYNVLSGSLGGYVVDKGCRRNRPCDSRRGSNSTVAATQEFSV